MPVTQPSAGVGFSLVSSLWARAPNSTKLPASKSRLRRSRKGSLPPPPSLFISPGPPQFQGLFFFGGKGFGLGLEVGHGEKGIKISKPFKNKKGRFKNRPFLGIVS